MKRLLVIMVVVSMLGVFGMLGVADAQSAGDSSGFVSPGSNAPRGAPWAVPENAHDQVDGTFSTSGTDSGTSHDWTNLGVAISALSVDGVTVQVEHRHSKDSNTGTYTCQLIDDVGNLCGSPKTSVNHGHKAEAVETLGGPADTWG